MARYTPEELRPLLEIYDWPVDEALLVVYGPTSGCPNGESTGYPTVTSRYGHRGLFQLYDGHIQRFERRGWTWDDAYVAERNIAIAYELWAETRDWRHWSCAPD